MSGVRMLLVTNRMQECFVDTLPTGWDSLERKLSDIDYIIRIHISYWSGALKYKLYLPINLDRAHQHRIEPYINQIRGNLK